MRISIVGEAEVISDLTAELEVQTGAEVQSAGPAQDLTEQAFGVAEAAAIIALVKSAAELAALLKGLLGRRSAGTQNLQLKTAVGAVTIELAEDATIDDLRRMVEPLFAIE